MFAEGCETTGFWRVDGDSKEGPDGFLLMMRFKRRDDGCETTFLGLADGDSAFTLLFEEGFACLPELKDAEADASDDCESEHVLVAGEPVEIVRTPTWGELIFLSLEETLFSAAFANLDSKNLSLRRSKFALELDGLVEDPLVEGADEAVATGLLTLIELGEIVGPIFTALTDLARDEES